MIFLHHWLEALINPFFLCLLAYAITLFTAFIFKYKLRYPLLVIFIILFFISSGWFVRPLVTTLENRYPPVNQIRPGIDWVVVLSGGQSESKDLPDYTLLYSASLKRLLEGLRLWQQNPEMHLLLTGGGYRQDKAESLRMAAVLSLFHIPVNNLQIEKESVNTPDQARILKQWLSNKPFYLVTSAIHMPRAMALCQKLGLRPTAAPTDYILYWDDSRWQKLLIPNAQNMVYFNIAFHEYLGLLWEKLTGQI